LQNNTVRGAMVQPVIAAAYRFVATDSTKSIGRSISW